MVQRHVVAESYISDAYSDRALVVAEEVIVDRCRFLTRQAIDRAKGGQGTSSVTVCKSQEQIPRVRFGFLVPSAMGSKYTIKYA